MSVSITPQRLMIASWSLLQRTRQSAWKIVERQRNIATFNQMIDHCKSLASRSLVVEDGTTNLRHLWLKDDDSLNGQLFDSRAATIIRWRINSNGSIQGGSHSKRFFLVQFCDDQQFDEACRYLQSKYGTTIRNNACFLSDGRRTWPKVSSDKIKLFIQPDILTTGSINRCRITTADHNRVIGQFDDHLLRPAARQHHQQWLARQKHGNVDLRIKHLITKVMQGQDMTSIAQYRIRFLICQQLEQLFRWTPVIKSSKNNDMQLNRFKLIPFGSDVSGFGTEDSDLDLCLVPIDKQRKVRTYRSVRILRSVSSAMQTNNFQQIQRIFRAFVPIIKCRSRLMPSINVDVSVDTEFNSGVQMASYLHYCSHSCPSVRGSILLLKSWAKHHGIIHSNPGDWFSSFQLTILAIAHLQRERLIPTIDEWEKQMRHHSQTTEQVKMIDVDVSGQIRQIVQRFFQFVVDYDFWTHAIDLRTGVTDLAKPMTSKTSACYVINPFVCHLNITKTVSDAELERFLCFCKQSLQLMQRTDFECTDLFTDRIDDRLQAFTSH